MNTWLVGALVVVTSCSRPSVWSGAWKGTMQQESTCEQCEALIGMILHDSADGVIVGKVGVHIINAIEGLQARCGSEVVRPRTPWFSWLCHTAPVKNRRPRGSSCRAPAIHCGP